MVGNYNYIIIHRIYMVLYTCIWEKLEFHLQIQYVFIVLRMFDGTKVNKTIAHAEMAIIQPLMRPLYPAASSS